MSKNLFETEKYYVREKLSDESIVGEDGKYSTTQLGYVVVNKETGIVEHSTVMLPGAIFQCQHFNDTLISLLTSPAENDSDAMDIGSMDVPEDIVPN